MQNADGGISDFRISGQSPIKRKGHYSRTKNHIHMKLGPVKETRETREKKQTQKNLTMTLY